MRTSLSTHEHVVQQHFVDDMRKIDCMIDIRRLRVLRALAEHGTVAAAADSLHLTPSAVSQQLAALEREVGQPVVERRGRGLVLAGAGEVLLEHAHALFAQLERAEADVAAHARGELGTVVIGAFPTALASLVPTAIERLGGTRVIVEERPLVPLEVRGIPVHWRPRATATTALAHAASLAYA
jgi:molybdate transport repressor ModE-like protein